MEIRPKKFDEAVVCINCKTEFMPNEDNKGFCETCDPQNAGVPIIAKAEPDKDLVNEGKAERLERAIKKLEVRMSKCEKQLNFILSKNEKAKVVLDEATKTVEITNSVVEKGHHPTVCKTCGETFVAEFPANKICEKCKGDK